ncbi:MAG: glycosyltransferase [Erysipelotrichaceae bacterium]
MRIGIFTDTYLPDINGVVTSITTLQYALEAAGHEVFVITNHKALLSMEREGNVLRMPGVELKWLYGYILSTPFHLKAKEEVRKMELDVIHVHTEFGVGMFGRLVGKSLGIPVVTTYHTMYEDYTHYINFFDFDEVEKFTKKIATSFSKYFSEHAQAVIAPSLKTKDTLLKYGVTTPIFVIPTGLNLDRFRKENIDRAILDVRAQSLGIREEDFVVSFIGRIAPEKSILDVMEGFALAAKNQEHFKLLIVGGGPQLDELKHAAKAMGIASKVVFTDKVANNQIPYYYHLSDVFVSASLTETQGMTYIEALASGRCVMARNDEVVKDLLSEGYNGYLFDTTQELAEKLVNYAQMDSASKQTLCEHAIQSVTSYDAKTFADHVKAVYELVIQKYVGEYTVEKVQIGDDVVKITVRNEQEDYNRKLMVSVDSYFQYHLRKGGTLSAEVLDLLVQGEIILQAKQMVLRKLKNKDLTRKQVYDLLTAIEDLPIKEINAIVAEYEACHYIDDHAYVLNYIEQANARLKGEKEILRSLVKAGIPYDDAAAVLRDQSSVKDEKEKATRLAVKYYKSMVGKSVKEARRLLRNRLHNQGFDSSVSQQAIDSLDFSEIEDHEEMALLKVLHKAHKNYARKHQGAALHQRIIQYAMSKGFAYDEIQAKLEEMEMDFDGKPDSE